MGGQVEKPQSWNRYMYASNNPVTRLDPNGLEDGGFYNFERKSGAWGNVDSAGNLKSLGHGPSATTDAVIMAPFFLAFGAPVSVAVGGEAALIDYAISIGIGAATNPQDIGRAAMLGGATGILTGPGTGMESLRFVKAGLASAVSQLILDGGSAADAARTTAIVSTLTLVAQGMAMVPGFNRVTASRLLSAYYALGSEAAARAIQKAIEEEKKARTANGKAHGVIKQPVCESPCP